MTHHTRWRAIARAKGFSSADCRYAAWVRRRASPRSYLPSAVWGDDRRTYPTAGGTVVYAPDSLGRSFSVLAPEDPEDPGILSPHNRVIVGP